jgi:cation transport ATPase
MAKKKKSKKKSNSKANEEKKSLSPNFWRTFIAIILFVLALFLLLGGFHTGGSLPKGLFHAAFWAVGWAAYIVSPAFIVLGIYKLSAEDKKIPRTKFISALAAVLFFSSLMFTSFASRDVTGSYAGGHGGELGKFIGQGVLNILDKFPASLIFFVFTVITVCFAVGISPKVFLRIGNIFKSNVGKAIVS